MIISDLTSLAARSSIKRLTFSMPIIHCCRIQIYENYHSFHIISALQWQYLFYKYNLKSPVHEITSLARLNFEFANLNPNGNISKTIFVCPSVIICQHLKF